MKIIAHQIDGNKRSDSFTLRMFAAFLLVSALVLGKASVAQVTSPPDVIEISCQRELRSPGHYRLVEDCVLGVGQIGITITDAVDVELDLDGHIISGSGCVPPGTTETPTGILVQNNSQTNSSRVRVANGTLEKLSRGVLVKASDNNDFTKLTLVENCVGIELRNSSENNVSYNAILRNKSRGVIVNSIADPADPHPNIAPIANNNQVTFNVIDQNGSASGFGAGLGGVILIENNGGTTEGNNIALNAFSRNLQNGVILSQARNNIVASNVVTTTLIGGAGGGGIFSFVITPASVGSEVCGDAASGSGCNFLVGNIALNNETPDLKDGNPNCDNNKWRDNTFRISDPKKPSCIH
jgi:hypothetical protein